MVPNAVNATRLALKNCAPFTKCNLEINDKYVDTAENLDIVMSIYNLIEYSDNDQDSSATLYQYKRDEPPNNNANLTADNSTSFGYKVNLLGNIAAADPDNVRVGKLNVKIVVPVKYLSNFFRSLEVPLINCKIKLNLTWKKECVLSTADDDAHLISMLQNYTFQLLLCQRKIIKIFLNSKIKVFKRLFIGTNIKQKNKLKMRMLMPLNILI